MCPQLTCCISTPHSPYYIQFYDVLWLWNLYLSFGSWLIVRFKEWGWRTIGHQREIGKHEKSKGDLGIPIFLTTSCPENSPPPWQQLFLLVSNYFFLALQPLTSHYFSSQTSALARQEPLIRASKPALRAFPPGF